MLKEIRNYYGIPQSLLADCLGITRSLLSMAESGRRSLSSEINSRLMPLYLNILESTAKNKNITADNKSTLQKQELNRSIERRLKENEYKLIISEKRLAAMKEDHARSIMIQENIEDLKTKVSAADICLLEIIEIDARKLQRKTSEQVQLKLELEICSLQGEIGYLRGRMGD